MQREKEGQPATPAHGENVGVARIDSVHREIGAAKPPPGQSSTPMMFSRGFRAGMQREKEGQPATPAPGENVGVARIDSVHWEMNAAKPLPGQSSTPMMFSRGFRGGMQREKEGQPATPAHGENVGVARIDSVHREMSAAKPPPGPLKIPAPLS